MNPNLQRLQPYPFERLAALRAGIVPPTDRSPLILHIGEPKHQPPRLVLEALQARLSESLASYPATRGLPELRAAIADWLTRRFHLVAGIDPARQILPVNGTREALFAFAQAVIDPIPSAAVLMPNPFYQIYEGAALLAGATAEFLSCHEERGFLPDFAAVPVDTWRRCQLLYLCSPANPSGAVTDRETLRMLIELADEHDFTIAADECYSELYADEQAPPPGLLEVAAAMGRHDFKRCVVFHSLSKRSNVPGLRSGFVAGDATIVERFLLYRTYHGCAMPLHHQHASIAAWGDEAHVVENRQRYREKFAVVIKGLQGALAATMPPAGFYLWPRIPGDDLAFARELYARENLSVLPGQFLARETGADNPGAGRIRLALVGTLDECAEAAERIRRCVLHMT